MQNKAYIFGNHPLRQSLISQYEGAAVQVTVRNGFDAGGLFGDIPEEIVILTSETNNDTVACIFLQAIATELAGKVGDRRPVVHLLLQKAATMRMLLVSDFPQVVNDVFDVFPFTMEEAWAMHTMVRLPGLGGHSKAGLDRHPIDKSSHQFVHLVLAGFDTYAESIALTVARVAHFPNYDGKSASPLRTRITVVAPGIKSVRDSFISRYHTLFDNSYYRFIDVGACKSTLHHPQYEGRREDFVDVEWEFVDAGMSNPVVIDKLQLWARDPARQLTVVISGADDSANLESAIALPEAITEGSIPVWVRMKSDIISASLLQSPKYSNLIPFGMDDSGYDVSSPMLKMARLLNYFYNCSYGEEGVPTVFPRDAVDKAWRNVGSLKMKMSNVYNVMMMACKMHSLGHDPQDLSTYYALTQEEIESLSLAEHNRWSVERLLSGTRPCTDKERDAIRQDISLKKQFKKKDVHFDLCSYGELGVDETGQDVRIYDYDLTACIPLIVESFLKEEER